MTNRENKFLLALIVVFLVCGAALVTLKLVSDAWREKNYEYTQAYLQQLQQQRKPVSCENLPTEILGSNVFKDWAAGKGIVSATFCGSSVQPLKAESHSGFTTKAECENAISQSQGAGKYIESPDGVQAICMGGFGEPDSYVYLMHLAGKTSDTLKSCGTPCRYENGFWLDNNRFTLLETDEINPGETDYLAQLFDFKNQMQSIYKFTK